MNKTTNVFTKAFIPAPTPALLSAANPATHSGYKSSPSLHTFSRSSGVRSACVRRRRTRSQDAALSPAHRNAAIHQPRGMYAQGEGRGAGREEGREGGRQAERRASAHTRATGSMRAR
eukprot:6199088-Pleurochrysis_carterae.AAC.1